MTESPFRCDSMQCGRKGAERREAVTSPLFVTVSGVSGNGMARTTPSLPGTVPSSSPLSLLRASPHDPLRRLNPSVGVSSRPRPGNQRRDSPMATAMRRRKESRRS